MRMKDEGYYTLIEMKDEFSEAGKPVPIRRRTLYPAELWVQAGSVLNRQYGIIGETGKKVNSNGKKPSSAYLRLSPIEMPMARAARISWPSMGTNLVLPATVESGLWLTTLFIMPTA